MRRRVLPSLVLLGGLAAMAALYGWSEGAYLALRRALGLQPFAPFLDLHGVMAAVACWHQGVDVYAANPCDALGRVHVYSPVWLRLPAWFGQPGLTLMLGVALALAAIAAMLVLPVPDGRIGRGLLLAAAVSPDTVFALERANVDVLIFIVVAAAVPLLAGGMAARAVAYGLFLAMGLLKFYPLVLLGLLVRERPRAALLLGGAAAALAVLALLPLAGEIARALANILLLPAFSGTFGAHQLPQGVALLLPGQMLVPVLLGAALGAMALAGAVRLAADAALGEALGGLPRRHADLLLVGAVLMVGCFVAGESVEYRAIFLLLVLPALLHLARGKVLARGFMATAAGIVWLMWDPLVRRVVARLAPAAGDFPALPGLALWTLREVLWWGVMTVLAGLVAGVLRQRRPL